MKSKIISEEERHPEAAVTRVTNAEQHQERVASVTRVTQVYKRAWGRRSEQSTRTEGRVDVSDCVA